MEAYGSLGGGMPSHAERFTQIREIRFAPFFENYIAICGRDPLDSNGPALYSLFSLFNGLIHGFATSGGSLMSVQGTSTPLPIKQKSENNHMGRVF